MSEAVEISIIVPLFNEEESLNELHERLTRVLTDAKKTYEILFVNDGSTDTSAAVIDALVAKDPCVGAIHFRRNFGKAAGLDAGFKRAKGDIVFTMDADLQDDPDEIPNFLRMLDEGYDLVSGWKKKRHDPLGKTLPSRLFNFVVSRASGLQLNDFNCGFKCYRREAIEGVELYGELHRYIPVLVHFRGFKVGQMAVTHHARKHGVSKYGVERMLKGFFDLMTVMLITRYRTRPLHLFGFVGLVLSFLGVSCLGYLSIMWLLGHGIGTRPLLFLGLLLVMVGVQFISTGLLGEMMNNLAPRSSNYVIRQTSTPAMRVLPPKSAGDVKAASTTASAPSADSESAIVVSSSKKSTAEA